MASLSRLTDREAVSTAIREYDDIGRMAFLGKYEFGKSRAYFLQHGGRSYDSKAIVGVAYGNQHPSEGPLHSDEFSGGESTVANALEKMGFSVSRGEDSVTQHTTNFWILGSRPSKYNIDDALQEKGDEILWDVGRHQVVAGDTVAIWRFADQSGSYDRKWCMERMRGVAYPAG
jgi:hypothetical protein